MKTIGLSPKAALAFFYPFIATCVAALASWISTGAFDASEIRVSLAGLVTSALALLGAYVGAPGMVTSRDG